ncbi:MAG TPA: hypothetical protein VNW30_10545 [Opitutaceae bacterium]|nr:hypothetical protein [Opitutaceae bacterium]
MIWLLNHPLILFVVAVAVANFVQKIKKAGTQQEARRVLDSDSAERERTRRVQEEIRRKIAERAGRLPASPPPVSPSPAAGPAAEPPARNIFQELARQMAEAKKMAEMQERARAASEAQVQQRMEDEQKSRERAEAQHLLDVQRTLQGQQRTEAKAVAYRGGADPKTTVVTARDKLLADLREPDSLRRAWMLREILGEPVGLR